MYVSLQEAKRPEDTEADLDARMRMVSFHLLIDFYHSHFFMVVTLCHAQLFQCSLYLFIYFLSFWLYRWQPEKTPGISRHHWFLRGDVAQCWLFSQARLKGIVDGVHVFPMENRGKGAHRKNALFQQGVLLRVIVLAPNHHSSLKLIHIFIVYRNIRNTCRWKNNYLKNLESQRSRMISPKFRTAYSTASYDQFFVQNVNIC